MFIIFDYKCPDCGHTEERCVHRSEMDTQTCRNPDNDCCASVTRLPAGTRTLFRFNDKKLKK